MRTILLNALMGSLLVFFATTASAATWNSAATGGPVEYTVTQPSPPVSPPALIIYLVNLSCERIGQEPDATILADFTANGYRVVQLDYAHHANATSPQLNADVLKIRNEIGTGAFPGSNGLNTNKNQCYILCEGYRLMRNVPYYLNDPTVYSGSDVNAELRMDIAYPSQPSRPIPIVMEYSTSNSYAGNENDRMRNDWAFTGTTDTILEGAPAAGIAWAMADQPKYRSWGSPTLYSGFEVNPDTIRKVRSSVRVLREVGATLGLSGNIAIHGFSRGASAGSMAAGDLPDPAIDAFGYSQSLSPRVQAVLLGSGLYDFTHSGGVTTGDPAGTQVDIYNRFVTAWGPTATNTALWDSQGAIRTMATTATAPVFLSYNTDDGTYYPYQAQRMQARLVELGVPHEVRTATGGHKVTTNPDTLTAIYDFFKLHAHPVPNAPGTPMLTHYDSATRQLDLSFDTHGNNASVLYAIRAVTDSAAWVQPDGSFGSQPAWQTLAEWDLPVRVGPVDAPETTNFSVIAYDPEQFTTAVGTATTTATRSIWLGSE